MMAMMVATSCIDGKTSPLKFYDVQCFIGIPIVTNWCKFLSEGMDNYNVFFSGKSSKKLPIVHCCVELCRDYRIYRTVCRFLYRVMYKFIGWDSILYRR